jgi:tetraacyldisaccharide 4'-kinase
MRTFKLTLKNIINAPVESKWRKLLLSPLCLLSFFYGLLMSLRVRLYGWGILPSHSLPCKVISVGNLTLGGTGKTPLVYFLAEILKAKGVRVAILSRGYGGSFPGKIGVVTKGAEILLTPKQAGDEPYLLAEKLKGIPVLIGQERVQTGRYAIDQFQSEVLILDDGYQHLSLKRDVNLLLLDSFAPFGNGYVFPRGMLREPKSQISRADSVILTKGEFSDNIINLKKNLLKRGKEIPLFQVDYKALEIRVLFDKRSFPSGYLKGKRVLAFSGLGKPESFERTLRQLQVNLLGTETFPDHHWYTLQDWERIFKKGEELGVDGLVTTEKDWVRMKGFPSAALPLWAVAIGPVFPESDQGHFERFLWDRLGLAHG